MLTNINRVHIMTDETILNGFPRANKGTIIFFQKEKFTYIYYGDGEWRPITINNTDYEYHKEKKKEKEIVW